MEICNVLVSMLSLIKMVFFEGCASLVRGLPLLSVGGGCYVHVCRSLMFVPEQTKSYKRSNL